MTVTYYDADERKSKTVRAYSGIIFETNGISFSSDEGRKFIPFISVIKIDSFLKYFLK